jgi:hypothetical protein
LQVLFHLGRRSGLSDETYISVGPDEEHGIRCNAVPLPYMFVFTAQLPLPQRCLGAAEDLIVRCRGVVSSGSAGSLGGFSNG